MAMEEGEKYENIAVAMTAQAAMAMSMKRPVAFCSASSSERPWPDIKRGAVGALLSAVPRRSLREVICKPLTRADLWPTA